MIDRVKDLSAGQIPQADEIKERAKDFAATAKEQFFEGRDKLRHFITENPTQALGIAVGMGVLLGWLIKRR